MINITRGHPIYQNALGEKSKTNVIVSDFPLRWTVQWDSF